MDELLQWTTALNFDDYVEIWKETATSNISEMEASQLVGIQRINQTETSQDSVKLDSFRLTRDSSTAMRQLESAAAANAAPVASEWSAGNDVKATRELTSALQSMATI